MTSIGAWLEMEEPDVKQSFTSARVLMDEHGRLSLFTPLQTRKQLRTSSTKIRDRA